MHSHGLSLEPRSFPTARRWRNVLSANSIRAENLKSAGCSHVTRWYGNVVREAAEFATGGSPKAA